ncbi:acyltransferase [Kosakonia sp. MUSA4]|uniref:acyltransferase family protein n=1 Tax=Kosakonia sp. MUSA4 TaxID=2067958 RepID=UPI0015975D0B|nr:acyltransferase [Kosakonia sp. MUSA4]QJT80300.1 acyltransferase [Kosakonia sp. MUSA4]
MKGKIMSIHYLRGIAGLAVVLFHFRGYLNGVYSQKDLGLILFNSGAFGVDLFFMISGFIIALSTKNNTSKIAFAIRRFFRIYPCFIIIFTIGALLVYRFDPSENLLRALFFLHRDYTNVAPGFGYNVLGPAWTLTYEIYFYTTFVIAMSVSQKYRTLISSLLILVPMFVIQLHYNGHISLSGVASANVPVDNPAFALLRFMSSPILAEFVVGMLFYELFNKDKFTIDVKVAKFIFFVCCGFFITYYFSGHLFGFGLKRAGLISFALLLGFIIYDNSVGFKENNTLNFLGDISFSIYISHYMFINLLNFYKPGFYVHEIGLARLFMMLTITISAGTILHFYIEKPFISFGKKIENNLRRRNIKNEYTA